MIYADLHCDTLTEYEHLRETAGQMSIERARDAGARLVCFAAFLRHDQGDLYAKADAYADKLSREIALSADIAMPVLHAADLELCRATGKLGCVFTIEEGGAIEGDLAHLAALYRKGLRMMTLTWNFPNALGYPNCDMANVARYGERALYMPDERGLTAFGRDVVAEMDRLGILVDVSHLSDGGFWEVARLSRRPFVASHSNARAVRGVSRNLTDDMIRALADHGGVMGLNLCPDFLCEAGEDVLTWAVRHVAHVVDVGGEDVIAVGTDFDGTDTRAPLADCGDIPTLYDAVAERLSPRVADKMAWSNFARVFAEACG